MTTDNVRPRKVHLQRHFALACLAGMVVVVIALATSYRALTDMHLVEHESRANADLARAFANFVGETHRPFLTDPAPRDRDALLSDARLQGLHHDVVTRLKGLKVAKVKAYDLQGMTVYSTDPKQIGEDKSGNEGFQKARRGEVAGALTYRDRFDAFEGVLAQRSLIYSYVPMRHPETATIEGVFEIYSDVTDLLQRQHQAQWQIVGVVLLVLGTLYVFLHVVVRRADRLIDAQAADRAQRETQIRHQAYHDGLTGLPNRTYFAERLEEQIAAAERTKVGFTLLFVDLDRFKIVNDSLGHAAGDEVLNCVAARMRKALRTDDLLFRMGGDEFTVILNGCDSAEDAANTARRLTATMTAPMSIQGHEFGIGATIGIAIHPQDGPDAATLVRNADAAMYAAKAAGRGTYMFYRLSMNEQALHRLELEGALQSGFRDGEFALVYQPRVDRQRRIVAVEALLRWHRPRHGTVAPADFIGVLEDMGLMPMVDEWVLRQACEQLRRWRASGLENLRVSVNVSPSQFQRPGFQAVVARVLAETGVPTSSIELELTESLLMRNPEQAQVTVAALKSLGVRIAIDDFGTGYSSLNYLRRFEFDLIKIDRSFVVGVEQDPRDRALATAVADLSRALKTTFVVEGVETEAQAAFFTSIQCGEMQGYLFGRPVPPDRLFQQQGAGARDAELVAG